MDAPSMTRMEPTDVGGLLDRIFRYYLSNFALMIGTLSIVYIPFVVISMLWRRALHGGSPLKGVLAGGGFLLWAIIFMPLATGAITWLVSSDYLGNRITISQAYGRAFDRLWGIIFGGILAGLAIGLGTMCFCVPGFMFMTWFAVVIPVVVLEGVGATDALDRSKQLSLGYRMQIFWVLLVFFAMNFIVGAGVGVASLFIYGIPKPGQPQPLLPEVIQHVASLLVSPLHTIAAVMIYYDLRVRKEGFDLQMLARAVAGQPTVLPATPWQQPPPPPAPPQGPTF